MLNQKIKEWNDLLIGTGLFIVHPFQKDLDDIDSTPHHLCCIDNKIVVYLDHKHPDYFLESAKDVKISIMDWSRKDRPKISFEEFYELTTDDVREKLLFYKDFFKISQ